MGGIGASRVPEADGSARCPGAWETLAHVGLIIAVCGGFDALFLHHGIGWLFDEGWPLYAAMQLHQGGTLYGDVFFLFPPGHVLPAWIAYALDPPGVVLARGFYALFDIALCVAIYGLGRQLMAAPFALWAALALALAAPRSHLLHLLFGYRYLVFSVLALLAASQRWRGRGPHWMGIAGVCCGLALVFRLTPAFAVSCGIGTAVLLSSSWRDALRDLALYGAGIAIVVLPVAGWLAAGAGLEAAWSQAVSRILPLQAAQSLPIPELHWLPTHWSRADITEWFVAAQFVLYPALFVAYAAGLVANRLRTGRDFAHPLLLAVVVWGAVYALRAIGRSDEHHLVTALPPALLLLAHALGLPFGGRAAPPRYAAWCSSALLLAVWIGLQGSDLFLDRRVRGIHPLGSLAGHVSVPNARHARRIDASVERIRRLSQPDELILDLSHAPLMYVLTDRRGPGYGDVVTPGVFADPDDEQAFVERLERNPPVLVLWPRVPFDGLRERSLDAHAPRLAEWVRANYRPTMSGEYREILLRRSHGVGGGQ